MVASGRAARCRVALKTEERGWPPDVSHAPSATELTCTGGTTATRCAGDEEVGRVVRCLGFDSCSLGLLATSQQYFSLRTNQPPATSQQYSSLRRDQHQPSSNRTGCVRASRGWSRARRVRKADPRERTCEPRVESYEAREEGMAVARVGGRPARADGKEDGIFFLLSSLFLAVEISYIVLPTA
jgi:hypothetical protein